MLFDILTVFPEYFLPLDRGIVGKAIEDGVFSVRITDIRSYSKDKHFKTDDTPYGGGAGMVMTPDPIVSAVEDVDPKHEALRLYMSPKGKTLSQSVVEQLSGLDRILILCGDYEGVDERALELCFDGEISIGDYVLTGGELPAMVLVNAVSRYIGGVLGCAESTKEESFSDGLLEYPHYTRPAVYRGIAVPEVLLNGNHADISEWRLNKSLEITAKRRPDLLIKQDIEKFLPKSRRRRR